MKKYQGEHLGNAPAIKTNVQPPVAFEGWTPAQIELVKNTVAKGATNNELALFMANCNRLGLDPFTKQIHFVKYGNSAGNIIIGIDGFRLIAQRTGKLSGIKRGLLKDEAGSIVGAWAEVMRSDWQHPAREEVSLREYDKGTATWKNLKETMIKKVAEAAALRMAFAQELAGIYSDAEEPAIRATQEPDKKVEDAISRLESVEVKEEVPQEEIAEPGADAEEVSLDDGSFVITFGRYTGNSLREISKDELQALYIQLKKQDDEKAQATAKEIQSYLKRLS